MMATSVWNDEPSIADSLGRATMSDALCGMISNCQTPLVLGLYGTWGVGKTSLMKLIESKLELSGEVVTVWFDAWQHQFDENPAVALLHKMTEDLSLGQEGRRLLFAIASAFGELALKRLSGVSSKDLLELQEQYEEQRFAIREKQIRLRDYFAELLAKASGNGRVRIVFFIDDLDRCLPENILSVLEALKLFLNMPGCVYVLGVDRQALEDSIRHRYPSTDVKGVEYLDKIVQVPFVIPRISSQSASAYVKELLPEELVEASELLVRGLSQNPRQIKRFINAFVLNHAMLNATTQQSDPTALAAVLLLQLRHPEIYKAIAMNYSLLEHPVEEWVKDKEVADLLAAITTGGTAHLSYYFDVAEITSAQTVRFEVVLESLGDKKIQVIKAVRSHTELGLADAKDLVEQKLPVLIHSFTTKEAATALADELRAVGAGVVIA